ncbi:peptidoglycan D,D-transpeptidase FtsI family protein [Alkaliphilus peptidifermentans]|uniref:Peptidoglycan glycosyltransferase n=1 Tax=Alkaliphilus peptidifermentans DSM 18978 TaxID=1120976 RepID=A0A1G5KDK5_9FIRM|nr:penicillin-binding transpeptidase domain-containing protein [Alkaliphilus peptidifermentans]SCY98331.1 peptidoglycan glycosyltransferase [Alkaliphilus peptidifermentans DSM 18978]
MLKNPDEKLNKNIITKRLLFLGVISTIFIIALGIRLFYLQIVKHDLYTTEVNKQRSLTIPLNSGRGYFFDRNFIPLTDRTEDVVIILFPQLFIQNEENLSLLESITNIPSSNLEKRIKSTQAPLEFDVEVDINWKAEEIIRTRGLFIVNRRSRYDDNPLLAHIIGYINSTDKKGMSGLEKSFNSILSNSDEKSLAAVVDGRKRFLPGEGYYFNTSTKESTHVQLTIDFHFQKLVEEILDKYNSNGAVVISDIKTGEVLTLASRPNFAPNNINYHLNSSGDELFNKAIQMTFPPGSIFKLIVTAEGLEKGLIDIDESFFCSGVEIIGNTQIRCSSHNRGGHGDITFRDSFAESCNSTFIQIGQKIGAKNIIKMAERFGLGKKIDIGVLEEESGNLPQGDSLLGPSIGNISIGQGEIEVTPLQINQLTQIIANNGIKKDLSLIKAIVDDNYGTIETFKEIKEEVIISEEIAYELQTLMNKVMMDGTGKLVGGLAPLTAGKTGSAQSTDRGVATLHGWFTGYYPYDEPKYAITIFIQNGGFGSQAAVPIFRDIIEEIINKGEPY